MNNDQNNPIENNVTQAVNSEPVTPVTPVAPVAPTVATPVNPTTPVEPTVATPVTPAAPVAPTVATPVTPAAPVAPTVATPVTPAAPVEPTVATPVTPAAPVAPTVATPVTPAAPVAPTVATPVTPAAPVAPTVATPVTPTAPVTPTITTPVTPAASTVVQPDDTIGGNKVATAPTSIEQSDGTIKANDGPNKKLIIMLIMIVVLAAIFIWLLKKNNILFSSKPSSSSTPTPQETSKLLENAAILGHACSTLGSSTKCVISIGNVDNPVDYTLNVTNSDLFLALGDYSDYVKTNIYYTENGTEKTIVDYKLFLISTNEEISNTITEAALREKIGLFSIGEHTETLTLVEIGTPGVGMENDESYTYNEYLFKTSKDIKYEMKYKNPPANLKLEVGKDYSVTFDVTKDLEYEYNIKSVK